MIVTIPIDNKIKDEINTILESGKPFIPSYHIDGCLGGKDFMKSGQCLAYILELQKEGKVKLDFIDGRQYGYELGVISYKHVDFS